MGESIAKAKPKTSAPQNGRKSSRDGAQDFSLRQHDIRALTCFAIAATAFTHIQFNAINMILVWFGITVIAYTIATYIIIKRSVNQNDIFDRFTIVDAALIGVMLNFTGYSLLPSIMFVTLVQFNALVNGGIRKWALDNAALISAGLVSFFIQPVTLHYSENLHISSASLIGIVAYFCSYALFAHKRVLKLDEKIKKLTKEHTLYKLKTYKLARYLTPTVWRAINEDDEQALSTQRKRVTIFFSDIQGFSSLAEELEAETLTELLNSYLTEMARIASKHKGTIDKYIGDGVMVIFGDSQSEGMKMDCVRCVSMAIEMRKKMKELQVKWYNEGIKKPMLIRMGINTGFCTVGTFGTSHYMDYTVLGTQANIASRLESAAEPGEILISHETWSLVKDVVMCRDQGEITVKGSSHPVRIYQVVDFRKDLGQGQTWFEENTSGFSMHMDLEKIRNYDKDKVLETLEKALERLKNKIIN